MGISGISFRAKGNISKALETLGATKDPKAGAVIEKIKGYAYGLTNSQPIVDEAIKSEILLGGNSNFVEGAVEALSKKAAKDLYKNV